MSRSGGCRNICSGVSTLRSSSSKTLTLSPFFFLSFSRRSYPERVQVHTLFILVPMGIEPWHCRCLALPSEPDGNLLIHPPISLILTRGTVPPEPPNCTVMLCAKILPEPACSMSAIAPLHTLDSPIQHVEVLWWRWQTRERALSISPEGLCFLNVCQRIWSNQFPQQWFTLALQRSSSFIWVALLIFNFLSSYSYVSMKYNIWLSVTLWFLTCLCN